VKFLFPTAPVRPVSINSGLEMPAWFDISSLDPQVALREEDYGGIMSSAGYILSLIEKEEAAGIPRDRIVVAGFSQGGVVALTVGLATTDLKVAGVISLSSWLPALASPCQPGTPTFMGHGDSDGVVLYRWGLESFKKIQGSGAKVEFKTYEGVEHGYCPQELMDCADFLREVLPEKQA